jgi:hypothetical protein
LQRYLKEGKDDLETKEKGERRKEKGERRKEKGERGPTFKKLPCAILGRSQTAEVARENGRVEFAGDDRKHILVYLH